jgi:hypothetical protein
MTVKLMVNWRAKEILTVKELDERIDARVDEIMQDTDDYNEYLHDYLDSNYSMIELFEALSGSDTKREEVLNDIRSGVAEAVHDWVDMDVYSDFSQVTVEV